MASILVVDDLAHCRQWLVRAAKQAFPEAVIETADSVHGATQALTRGSAQLPNLLLADLGLPDGDGVEVIRDYRRRCPHGLIVVSTVFDDDAHLFPALRAGAQGYLLKDEPVSALAEKLAGICAGQPPLSASIARRLLRHFALPVETIASKPDLANSSPTQPRPNPRMVDDSAGEALTEREVDVLTLIAKGLSVPRVAELLGLSKHTVSGYLKDVYRKLEISSRAEAAMVAARRGFVH